MPRAVPADAQCKVIPNSQDSNGPLVVIRGAGDTATAVGRRLFLAGFPVVMTELGSPLCVRRSVAYSEAVFEREVVVEGVGARLARLRDLSSWPFDSSIAVIVDECAQVIGEVEPGIVVDARILKRRADTDIRQARLVAVLGPGVRAGVDCHFVVETQRGHNLGRVMYEGEAEPDTREPAAVLGHSHQRVMYAERGGTFETVARIGDSVNAGDVVARIDEESIISHVTGTVRGLLRSGMSVVPGTKVGDVDPRNRPEFCFTISDRSNAIAGGVMEGIFALRNHRFDRGRT